MRDYLIRKKQELDQEPRGGKRFWYVLIVGCFAALGGGYFLFSSENQIDRFASILQLGGGTGMAVTSVAELLAKDKVRLASGLRKLSLAVMAVAIAGAAAVFFT